jgi:hypothetical protein
MKNAVFRDMAPCRFCENQCFGGTCCLHLLGGKKSASGEQDLHGTTSLKMAFFLYKLFENSVFVEMLKHDKLWKVGQIGERKWKDM